MIQCRDSEQGWRCWVGVGVWVGERGEVWYMSARLLEVEWPQAFPSHVHVPNSDPPEPSHRASLERKQEGPCQEALY